MPVSDGATRKTGHRATRVDYKTTAPHAGGLIQSPVSCHWTRGQRCSDYNFATSLSAGNASAEHLATPRATAMLGRPSRGDPSMKLGTFMAIHAFVAVVFGIRVVCGPPSGLVPYGEGVSVAG